MSDDKGDVRLEIRIDAAPETVFAMLTDRAHMQTWFAEIVEAYKDVRRAKRPASDADGARVPRTRPA